MAYEQLKLENQLCFPLYAAARETVRRYTPYLDEIGLTYTQYITMMVLWEHERLSVKEIGGRLFLDSGTLTPLLKKLEAAGYLRRTRSETDERVVLAELTAEGRALQQKAGDIPAKVGGCMPLEAAEAGELYRLLYKLLGTGEQQQ